MDLKVKRATCPNHPDRDESGKCGGCGTSICRDCVSAYGYFCSEECRDSTKARITEAERAATADSAAQYQRGMRVFKLVGLAVALCALAGVGYLVWLKFFDRRGSVVWRWKPGGDVGMVDVLGGDDEAVYLYADRKLYRLRLDDGSVLSQVDCEALDSMSDFRVLPDRIIAWGFNQFVTMTKSGEDVTTIPFGELGAISPTFDAAYENAWFIEQDYTEGVVAYRLHRVPLVKGKKPVVTELKNVDRATLLGVDDGIAVVWQDQRAVRGSKHKAGWSVRIVAMEGKDRRMSLDGTPDWGPSFEAGWLKWRVGNMLHVASVRDGASFEFELPSAETIFEPAYLIRGDQLLLALPGGTVCCSLKDGKALWKSQLKVDPDYFVTTEDAFISLGSRKENVEIDMSGIGGANKVPGDLLKDMGMPGGKTKRVKTVSVLAAIDRKTGSIKWMEEHVRGAMVADDKRIAFVMDTSVTGAVMGTEEPSLYVRQFDIGNGKEIVNKHSEDVRQIGESTLIGRYVINVYNGNMKLGDKVGPPFNAGIKAPPSEYPDDDKVIVQAILLD